MARKRRGRPVNGILVLDKPSGITSNGALQRVKRLFDAAKAGHTGSLDPLATGVLPLCLGEATKFSHYLLDADKGYLSTFVLGVGTDTLDIEGEEIARADASSIDAAAVERAMIALTGALSQIPPMYSALKREGQPLYKLARAGIEVERQPRAVTIHEFSLRGLRLGMVAEADVVIRCTKGTYVRSLAESLGLALGVPAHVSVLRRDIAGPYQLAQAVSLDTLETLAQEGQDALDALLTPIDDPLKALPAVQVGDSATYYLKLGQAVLVPNGPRSGMVRAYSASGLFLGVGEMLDDGRVAPRRLVVR